MSLPELIRPMLATAGVLPPAAVEDRWAYEMKWDGVRAVVYLDGGRVRAMTRNDREVSASYPELRGLAMAGSRSLVLDGELVAFRNGRPDFGELQQRMHVVRPGSSLLAAVPVSYFLFDVLWLDGRSLVDAPWAERRVVLESLDLIGDHWDTPAVFLGSGSDALSLSRDRGLEGVVAKAIDRPYEPGRRSASWVKVKHVRMQEVVIGGWKEGSGSREGGIGSLLLGVPGPTGLEFAGHVGTGFTVAMLDALLSSLRPMEQASSPFSTEVPRQYARFARWARPEIVGEVVFTEWTRDGRLRQPAWRGLRPDRTPADITRELH